SSFQSVFETGEVDHLPLIPYPIPGPERGVEERYWSATHTPIKDGDGNVSHILQHTVDVTELHRLRTISGDWKTQTNLLKRADAVQGRNRVLDEEREYLRSLFEQAPGFMAVLRGPDHVFTIANKAYRDLVDRDDLNGKSVREALPELTGQVFYDLLDEAYASGKPYAADAAHVRLLRENKEVPEELYLNFF